MFFSNSNARLSDWIAQVWKTVINVHTVLYSWNEPLCSEFLSLTHNAWLKWIYQVFSANSSMTVVHSFVDSSILLQVMKCIYAQCYKKDRPFLKPNKTWHWLFFDCLCISQNPLTIDERLIVFWKLVFLTDFQDRIEVHWQFWWRLLGPQRFKLFCFWYSLRVQDKIIWRQAFTRKQSLMFFFNLHKNVVFFIRCVWKRAISHKHTIA